MPTVLLLGAWLVLGQPGLDGDGLAARLESVLPTAEEERFLAIPWLLSLMEARQVASEKDRPIFLWIMNGHPLGCT